jgi:hypothetical protein
MTSSDIWYNERGLWVHKATPTATVPTVYNGLWLTAALEEKRGTDGDDLAMDIC